MLPGFNLVVHSVVFVQDIHIQNVSYEIGACRLRIHGVPKGSVLGPTVFLAIFVHILVLTIFETVYTI